MLLADILAHYVYFLRLILIFVAGFILISSIDDAFIDLLYWLRFIYRRVILRVGEKRLNVEQLYIKAEAPFAVIIPAWQEEAVIKQMLQNTSATIDYENYQIFVGVYQNDPATKQKVEEAQKLFDNVHIGIVPNDGPTCKADCLNWLFERVLEYEEKSGEQFAGIVMHDAEGVVHRLELRLFNYLIDRKDLMQLPVFSLERPWYEFVAGHYIDEFAEAHSKDLLVREMLTGVVPSAGVATCFSRRAIAALANDKDGVIFNTNSLTEDYDISFRLKEQGMTQIFLRYGIMSTVRIESAFNGTVKTLRQRDYVATREYFPDSVTASVKQKSRWILGIVFQGWENIGWKGNLATRYILLRDRKSVLTAFATVLAYFILLNLVIFNLVQWLVDDAFRFPPLVIYQSLEWWLLLINLFFLVNRVFHRAYFAFLLYGWDQAILSFPRLVVGNFIHCMASFRALRLFINHVRTGKQLTWDKTSHAYPSYDQLKTMRKRLGELLVEQAIVTEATIQEALEIQKRTSRPLGEVLLDMRVVSIEALAPALARHMGIKKQEAIELLKHSQEGKN
ncbi:MAG: glycosyl transferase family protein [Rickettsiales bacterium]|nr:glycosyl transferase family protein [Rickettsiales bacterium]